MADRTDWTGHQFEHFPGLQKAYNDLFGAAADEFDELIADLRAESAAAAEVTLPRSRWLGWVKRGRR
jgi:hypothetical protein